MAFEQIKELPEFKSAHMGHVYRKIRIPRQQFFKIFDPDILVSRRTGADMKKKYKETARGGLAVNVIEC